MKTKLISLFALTLLLNCSNGGMNSAESDCNSKLDSIIEKSDKILLNQSYTNADKDRLIQGIMGQENFKDTNFDLYLRLDGTLKDPQLLHIDLVHQFAVQTEMEVDSNGKLNKMTVMLREIENSSGVQRNTLDLKSAKYTGKRTVNGQTFHDIEVEINRSTSASVESNVNVTNIRNVIFTKGDLIDIHIQSDVIPTIFPYTNFGQQFCKSIVTAP